MNCSDVQEVTAEPDYAEDMLNMSGNGTIHCSKTEFKCCPDWYTAADGANNLGCPEFELGKSDNFMRTSLGNQEATVTMINGLGACNDTEHGCCDDEVTLARGADMEGCGDPTCSASLYGCCKDRRSIAFGPYYHG